MNAHLTIEAVSLFPAVTILWVLSFCATCVGHHAPDYVQDSMHRTILQSNLNTLTLTLSRG